ncbi:MAG: helix-turn-helix domain-containing protein [Spirochaetaceae bacterium]|jgi:excisionase family DNA binding protein|nr:helix-turn-helix domain-containing protein [Spirochaetaceae bacterium]
MKQDFGTPELLSRREAAAYLGICRTTLDRLDIPRTRIRHRVVFKREALEQWVDEHTDKTKKSTGGKR